MQKLTTTTHRRPNGSARRTIAAHVDEAAVIGVDRLVERGIFVNRSHAIDAAIALLLRKYAELLGKEVCNSGDSGTQGRGA
ncbi:ribbon-helix-helix domain-containing protein (plasmid) [Thermomicrobium sp. 4228-Ro]|uniref:ribbon-helix-helix domain-containing protein n=1 Tax=Thermomicrobium sp. 4228-Ro TaxID=2993937 RepID=UPI0022490BE3|nr:ribbon-helix-helix domain-containing protein [Thermomicrobium sp. 4228-Ro]MCX2728529.1 ribbon-helix-helix domain-containing protein [Thermomicrobium sp. 4228-Ro]